MSDLNISTMNTIRKTAIASAIAVTLGGVIVPGPSHADIYTFQFGSSVAGNAADPAYNDALFTMLDPAGNPLTNTSYPYYGDPTWGYGVRTQISGTFTFDNASNSGSLAIAPFEFFNGGPAVAENIGFINAGTDPNNGHRLILANMLFNWGGNNGIPVSLVWDIDGLSSAINAGISVGDTISGGTLPGSDGIRKGAFPLGPAPVASTTWDTTPICTVVTANECLGTNPSGSLPLIGDTVSGVPMYDGPFVGFSANFDMVKMKLTDFQDTTPPQLTLIGNAIINVNVGDPYTEQGATCVDTIDGNLDSAVVIGGDTVDANTIGKYIVTYNCQDTSGNAAQQLTREVNVKSASDATITLIGAATIPWEGAVSPYVDPGATCADADNSNIPEGANFLLDSSTLNVFTLATQIVTWQCTGTSGIQVEQSRSVIVQDTIAPIITLTPNCGTGANAIVHIADGIDPTPTATANDPNFNTDLTASIVKAGDTVNPSPDFGSNLSITYNLNYSVSDVSGNSTLTACDIVQGNPDPVATLNGNATVVVATGADYTEDGAACADFTDGALPDAVPDMTIDGTTPNGNYTITYTCGPNTLGNTGTVTRNVIVGVAFSAASDSGSTFVMLDPTGSFVGGADDVFFSWDGSLYSDPVTQTQPNMFMGSAQPQPFFGFPWQAHDIRAFGPGDYTIPTSRGNTLNLHIAPNQIGAHMLFDWNNNNDIDVVLAWDIVGVFIGSTGVTNDLGSKGQYFSLTSIDADGDGLSGVPMADGPFKGFNANFNIKLKPLFALPDVRTTTAQGTNNPTTQIVSTADAVTVSTSVNPDVNGVFTYKGPFLYDWSSSDAVLLAVNTNGAANSTFVFNPDTLPDGPVKAVVKVTDSGTGVTSTREVPLEVITGTLVNAMDSDADGIPDSQDVIDNNTTPSLQQGESSNGNSYLLESSAGKLLLGYQALLTSTQSAEYRATITDADIGVTDTNVENSCVGGCFSFKVTGLAPGSAVDVVLPLSLGMPADAVVRKFVNGAWRDFVTTNGNAIMSAAGSAGSCPGPNDAGWTPGLTEAAFCLKLTIVDGGPNDADANANGIVEDPPGVAGGAGAAGGPPPGDSRSPNTGGGCSMGNSATSAATREDLWLLAGLLAWLGISRRKFRHQ
jgi:hypothetical protein